MLPSFPTAEIGWQHSDHIDFFQGHVVVEMWTPPDCFFLGLSSPVAKR